MSEAIESLLEGLEKLRPGYRSWFWLCRSSEGVVLLMESFRSDPKMAALRDRAAKVTVPLGGIVTMGIASVAADGTLKLGAPGLDRAGLDALASWAGENLAAYPGLARLKNTVFIQLINGAVFESFEQPQLWSDFPDPVVPGSIEDTARRLTGLKPGREFWYWMTDRGPGGVPFLALDPNKRDTSGAKFAGRIAELVRQSPAGGRSIRGLARMASGGLALTTTGDLEVGVTILRLLIKTHPSLTMLADARLVKTHNGRIVQTTTLSPAIDLSTQSSALKAMAEGQTLSFWFTDAAASGDAMLVIAEEPAGLKKAARAIGGSGRTVRGRLTTTPKGWLHFQTRQPYPDFIETLAHWAAVHHQSWPALARLAGARMSQLDDEGKTIHRQKNDAAWAFSEQE